MMSCNYAVMISSFLASDILLLSLLRAAPSPFLFPLFFFFVSFKTRARFGRKQTSPSQEKQASSKSVRMWGRTMWALAAAAAAIATHSTSVHARAMDVDQWPSTEVRR